MNILRRGNRKRQSETLGRFPVSGRYTVIYSTLRVYLKLNWVLAFLNCRVQSDTGTLDGGHRAQDTGLDTGPLDPALIPSTHLHL